MGTLQMGTSESTGHKSATAVAFCYVPTSRLLHVLTHTFTAPLVHGIIARI